jgi:hypothetical protein
MLISLSRAKREPVIKIVAAILLGLLVAHSADARTIRSNSARAEFKRLHPCPTTGARSGPCGGYVIDHVIPLARGGPDAPSNMQS